MKQLLLPGLLMGLFLANPLFSNAQSAENPNVPEATQPQVDKGSEGAITMEEYEVILQQFQKENPGKTFQDMTKEEFETYLTTELAALRQKRAEEAKKATEAKPVDNPK